MRTIFEQIKQIKPRVSVILLDWFCRESFHVIEYLNSQTVPREKYELIWIEFYSKQSSGIKNMIDDSLAKSGTPALDKWVVMDMPKNVYYHKHLMYNIGILLSRGRIICICDSDAIVKPSFIQSIISEFEKDENIVLHMDEARNTSKKFYPFNYPSIEEITFEGCLNFNQGKTLGLLDNNDILHTRNYGACMCALKRDIIDIGGADEHVDYLGHICGPYEMTFRLINAGKREVWHEREFLYHTWHPGTDGQNNYLGPHDGKNMSSTALDIIRTKRISPLKENKAVESARKTNADKTYVYLLNEMRLDEYFAKYDKRSLKQLKKLTSNKQTPGIREYGLMKIWFKFLILKLLLSMLFKQIFFKARITVENKVLPKGPILKMRLAFAFVRRMWLNNMYSKKVCFDTILRMKSQGYKQAAVYGSGDIADLLKVMAQRSAFKLEEFNGSVGSDGPFIVASFSGINEKTKKLQYIGVKKENIVRLQ